MQSLSTFLGGAPSMPLRQPSAESRRVSQHRPACGLRDCGGPRRTRRQYDRRRDPLFASVLVRSRGSGGLGRDVRSGACAQQMIRGEITWAAPRPRAAGGRGAAGAQGAVGGCGGSGDGDQVRAARPGAKATRSLTPAMPRRGAGSCRSSAVSRISPRPPKPGRLL